MASTKFWRIIPPLFYDIDIYSVNSLICKKKLPQSKSPPKILSIASLFKEYPLISIFGLKKNVSFSFFNRNN